MSDYLVPTPVLHHGHVMEVINSNTCEHYDLACAEEYQEHQYFLMLDEADARRGECA
jgi:hypothetical protein